MAAVVVVARPAGFVAGTRGLARGVLDTDTSTDADADGEQQWRLPEPVRGPGAGQPALEAAGAAQVRRGKARTRQGVVRAARATHDEYKVRYGVKYRHDGRRVNMYDEAPPPPAEGYQDLGR